jgi:hypothetical protein
MKKRGEGIRKNNGRYVSSISERAARADAQERYEHARAVWPDISSYGKSKPMKVIIYVENLFGPNRILPTLLISLVLWSIVRYIGKVLWHLFVH